MATQASSGAADVNGPTETAKTMRAIVQDAYGSVDVLRIAEVARPEVGGNEVLLRVNAAGLDRGVWHQMTGLPYLGRLAFGIPGPRNPVPGLDVAGTVVAVGADVTRWSIGDEVFGFGKGTFAEYATARQDRLTRKPPTLTFEQAAVLPVSGVTALLALTDYGKIQAGQKVLIIGASGGVGSYAVQMAKALGADVTAVCSTAKVDLVRSLGADRVIDYTSNDFADGTARYDLILDIGGDAALARLRQALTPTGTAIIVGGEGGGRWTGMGRQVRALLVSPLVKQRLTTFIARQRPEDLERLVTFVDAGTVTPSVGATYPLDEVPEAMRHLLAGQARGKTAITI